jgi:phage-related protein
MEVIYDPRVDKFIKKLIDRESAKVTEYVDLFEKNGFSLDQNYLKKVKGSIWELRPGRIRLFLYMKNQQPIAVHIIHKKTQKLPLKEMKVIEERIKQYI